MNSGQLTRRCSRSRCRTTEAREPGPIARSGLLVYLAGRRHEELCVQSCGNTLRVTQMTMGTIQKRCRMPLVCHTHSPDAAPKARSGCGPESVQRLVAVHYGS